MFNTKLEKLAFAVHLYYDNKKSVATDSDDYKSEIDSFETSEYNRRSSTASALHLYTKLFIFSELKNVEPGKELEEFTNLVAGEYNNELRNLLDVLAQNEHKRWNAYMCSEGYITADLDTVRLYAPYTNKNRDEMSKLHPCITDWDKLPDVDKIVDELHLSKEKSDYRENDINILKNIPDIFKLAMQKKEE